MLDCDECHKWFHGACVGVIPENVSVSIREHISHLLLTAFFLQVPARWFCDTCLIRRKVRSRKNGDTGAAPSIDLSQASLDMSVDEPNEEEVWVIAYFRLQPAFPPVGLGNDVLTMLSRNRWI